MANSSYPPVNHFEREFGQLLELENILKPYSSVTLNKHRADIKGAVLHCRGDYRSKPD